MEDCATRADSPLGSSKSYAQQSTTVMQEQGYLSNDPAVNPLFANWTKIYLPYGDGTSQLGDVWDPVIVSPGAKPIYFRGARVLRAMISFLLDEGLANATEVVVAGCSAGGLATYLHADTWAAALPKARVVAMPDSGFFLNFNATGVSPTFPERMLWTYANTNVSGGALLPPACLAAHRGSEWLCMFAENVAPTIKTPTFALQSVYDSCRLPLYFLLLCMCARACKNKFLVCRPNSGDSSFQRHGGDQCLRRHAPLPRAQGPAVQPQARRGPRRMPPPLRRRIVD